MKKIKNLLKIFLIMPLIVAGISSCTQPNNNTVDSTKELINNTSDEMISTTNEITAPQIMTETKTEPASKNRSAIIDNKLPKEMGMGDHSMFNVPPQNIHPRLYIRDFDLPELRERAKQSGTQIANYYSQIKSSAKRENSGKLPETKKLNEDINLLDAIKSKALIYLLDDDVQYGLDAVRMAEEYMATIYTSYNTDGYARGYQIGNAIHLGAMVYDWCFDLLTLEDQTKYINHFNRLVNYFEFNDKDNPFPAGFENFKYGWSVISGHHIEQQIRDVLALGVAIYDEEPMYWDFISDFVYNQLMPTSNFLMDLGTCWEGTSYGPSRFCQIAKINAILYRMAGEGKRESLFYDSVIDCMKSYLYYRRPDGQYMRMGDMFTTNLPVGVPHEFGDLPALLYVNSIYKDPYLMTEMNKLVKFRYMPLVESFIFWCEIVPKPVTDLPLTNYLKKSEMQCFTGWEKEINFDSNVMHVDMKIGEYPTYNHAHQDAGSFQIYYKGALAVDAGIYEGKDGAYASNSDINWNKRTISHNSILIYDKNVEEKYEKFDAWGRIFERYFFKDRMPPGYVNDGGQRAALNGSVPSQAYLDHNGKLVYVKNYNDGTDMEMPVSEQWRSPRELSHYIEPNTLEPSYSYLKGALQEMYDYRAEVVNRSFLFLNFKDDKYPGALIIFDKITSTDPNYEKYFLLHSMYEPEIMKNDNGFITGFKIQNTKDHGKNMKYNGQLVDTPLLPRGDNLECETVKGFKVFGYDASNRPNGASEEFGEYMLMIKPKNPAGTDLFLNVLQCQDAGTQELPVVMIGNETDDMVGALIHDCAAMFSANGKILNKEIKIPALNKNGMIKYHVADLAPGIWEFYDESKLIYAKIIVSDGGNFGYVEAPGEKAYTFVPENPDPIEIKPAAGSGMPQMINAVVEATTMILTFDKPLDDTILDRSKFKASGLAADKYNSSGGKKMPKFSSAVVSEDGMKVILELQNTALGKDNDVKINYTGDGNLMANGKALDAFENIPVKNNTYVLTVPPKVTMATIKGNELEIRFSIALYNGKGTCKKADPESFKIEGVNNGNCKITKVSVDNTAIILKLDQNSVKGDEIYVSYEIHESNIRYSPLTDGRNEVEAFKVIVKNNNRGDDGKKF